MKLSDIISESVVRTRCRQVFFTKITTKTNEIRCFDCDKWINSSDFFDQRIKLKNMNSFYLFIYKVQVLKPNIQYVHIWWVQHLFIFYASFLEFWVFLSIFFRRCLSIPFYMNLFFSFKGNFSIQNDDQRPKVLIRLITALSWFLFNKSTDSNILLSEKLRFRILIDPDFWWNWWQLITLVDSVCGSFVETW